MFNSNMYYLKGIKKRSHKDAFPYDNQINEISKLLLGKQVNSLNTINNKINENIIINVKKNIQIINSVNNNIINTTYFFKNTKFPILKNNTDIFNLEKNFKKLSLSENRNNIISSDELEFDYKKYNLKTKFNLHSKFFNEYFYNYNSEYYINLNNNYFYIKNTNKDKRTIIFNIEYNKPKKKIILLKD